MHFQSVQMKQTPPAQGIFLLIFTVHGMRWTRQHGQKIDQATGQKIYQATGQEIDQATGQKILYIRQQVQEMDQAAGT
jgi:hypothetical protein